MIRPTDATLGQGFGENPTSQLPAGHWILKQFGNYQPDGHAGQDYPCPVGTHIRAVTSGTVLHVGYYKGTYRDNPYWIAPNFAGWCYVINHDPAPGFPGGFIGIYAHGKDNGARVTVGQRVTEGQVIGLSGNTGGSTGSHLHFEILPDQFIVNSRMYGRVNPELLFTSGITSQGTTTPASEEDDVTAKDVWDYPLTIDGKEYPAHDVLRYSRANAIAARDKADAAPGLAVQTLLATRLPAPDGSGASYTIAEYITYGWMYSMKAKDSAAAIEPLDPSVLTDAIAKANATAVASQLEITVKEN